MSHYHLRDFIQYTAAIQDARRDPEAFWEHIARDYFEWHKEWDRVLDYDFHEPRVEWFKGAKLNITENCIDRHLSNRGDQTAIIFEPDDPTSETEYITYQCLSEQVNRWANLLRSRGVQRGDRVCIYLPMIPELAYVCLACARMGAIHSVVFAGFSASALAARIIDSQAKAVVCSDGSFRGGKVIDLKSIVNEALEDCPCVETVLTVRRVHANCTMKSERDLWVEDLLDQQSTHFAPESMDAEDPLFILYTSGSTGAPKGMVHTTAGYMVYTAYTFNNVFRYQDGDIYWCTADIGWITGHSYILYGPLANGATTLMFEGVPSYPDYARFWQIVEKHRVTQFYTAPTAIRAFAQKSLDYVNSHDISSLRILGTVGEPIDEEAWRWYHKHIGAGQCPIVDTWWQTETGGILISPIPYLTAIQPSFAMLPMPGILPELVDDEGQVIESTEASGRLCIATPWPSMARTIWSNHQRYKETYFSAYPGMYFTGDGAMRDAWGYYRITGRVDDVIIVSGHNLGSAPIEDAINEHHLVSESAIVGIPHDIKGNALYGFVVLKESDEKLDLQVLAHQINQQIRQTVGPIAKLDKIQFAEALPKTRSGKIMRRLLRKIATGAMEDLGDLSTLVNPDCIPQLKEGHV